MTHTLRTYSYVGPDEIRQRFANEGPGTPIRAAKDLAEILGPNARDTLTFVVDVGGVLRVANRRSEHVACAGGGEVLSAGELTAAAAGVTVVSIVDISNQSTGYCPEPESWPAVARALDSAGIGHPGHFTYEAIFRRCVKCGQRNLVKESWFVCALCDAELPAHWNFFKDG